jgi:curli biogenesis system outer membrane secretion channel CsgG
MLNKLHIDRLQFRAMILVVLIAAAQAAFGEGGTEKRDSATQPVAIAVFDFTDSGVSAPGAGRAVSEMLIGKLAADPVIRIFERGRLDEIMQEQKRANPSDMDGNSIRAGRPAGVQFLLLGKITEFGVGENSVWIPGQGTVTKYKARVTLDIRAVQVSNAQVVKTWNATGGETSFNLGVNVLGLPNFNFGGREFEDSLLGKATRKAVENAAAGILADFRSPGFQKLATTLRPAGLVADVDGSDIILNIGKTANAQVGQLMVVYRVTKEVRDPDTGELLTEKRKRIGELTIIHVEEKFSRAAVMKLEPTEEIRTGDIVIEEPPVENNDELNSDTKNKEGE